MGLDDAEALRQLTEITVNASSEAIYWLDEEGQVYFVNDAACRMLGYTREELLSLSIFDINRMVPEGYAKRWGELRDHGSYTFQSTHYRKDGTRIPVEVSANLVHFQGKDYSFAFTRDITERKRAEEELREAKEAAEAGSAAKSSFLANMSHEFRTPLNGILGMSDLLLESRLEPEQREYAESIQVAAESFLDEVNKLLDISKIEAGKLVLDIIDFELPEILRTATDDFAASARNKSLALELRMAPGLPDRVRGDPGRLRQVIVNLIDNAVKFTESGGVVVDASASSLPSGGFRLEVCVRDTGIGIPAESVGVLFEPFTQVDASMTRRYGGTGLGLSICKSLVTAMGGAVGVESELGKGSRFRFDVELGIPASTESSTPVSAVSPARYIVGRPGARILVVEDNAVSRKVVLRLLERLGHTAGIAENGTDALKALGAEDYDAVLMDIQMPEMDGLEATRAIRDSGSDVRNHGIPIIAMTANTMAGYQDHCLSAGMSDYIGKPVRLDRLAEVLEKWLSQSGRDMPGG